MLHGTNALKGGSDGAQTGILRFSTNRILLRSGKPTLSFNKLRRNSLFIDNLLKVCKAPSEPPANLLSWP